MNNGPDRAGAPRMGARTTPVSRRKVITGAAALVGGAAASRLLPSVAHASRADESTAGTRLRWVATTQSAPWQMRDRLAKVSEAGGTDLVVRLDRPAQNIEGFGACFNELGWMALAALAPKQREVIFRELFAPGVGADFSLCRMPVGANDFSRDWYSYDEVEGDFDLKHFSIANDLETLVPFIRQARLHRENLRLWASPWSPPTWMKRNRHYAAAMPAPWQTGAANGLRPDQVGREGTDMFVQEERYFRAYAAYFGRFVDEYRKQGIDIEMVMPQNEFNSAQVFPSCTWTPEGLARFLGFLGPEMARRGVDVFFGTVERPNETLVDVSLRDALVSKYIKGVGFQWAGKGAIAGIHRRHPDLRLYQTEQECGDGRNDWRYCRYAWRLMRHYLENGANAYLYWNIALRKGGVSRWGWAQNSLVTVDTEARTFGFNPEYYLMKHVSHFVKPGSKRVETDSWSGYDNALAFVNPDGSVVAVLQNDSCEDLPVRLGVGASVIAATLPADSFNTFLLEA